MVSGMKWLEVLVVIVEEAGKSEIFDVPNMRDQKVQIKERKWSNRQKEIEEHLKYAEYIWGVKVVHGKRVDKVWKDFVRAGSSDFQAFLRYIRPQGDTLLQGMVEQLDRIWAATADQRLSNMPAIVIYTDPALDYGYTRLGKASDPYFQTTPDVLGVTWKKGSRNQMGEVKWFKNLSRDVVFIFPDAPIYVTAHELGHLVADLPNVYNDPTNLMAEAFPGNKEVTEQQKRRFLRSPYIQRGPLPRQGWESGLLLPPIL